MNTAFDGVYVELLDFVLAAKEEQDQRTGIYYRARPGLSFSCGHGGGLPLVSLRNINTKWFCAEAVWHMSGGRDPDFMKTYGFNAWSKFPQSMNWGPTFRGRGDGIDLLLKGVAALRHDRTKKSIVFQLFERDDIGRSHRPCISSMALSVIGETLHTTVLQRSADLYFGLPHDVAGIAIIRAWIARYLNLKIGAIYWTVANAHVYANQYFAAHAMVEKFSTRTGIASADSIVPSCTAEWKRAIQGEPTLVFDLHRVVEADYLKFNPPKSHRGIAIIGGVND